MYDCTNQLLEPSISTSTNSNGMYNCMFQSSKQLIDVITRLKWKIQLFVSVDIMISDSTCQNGLIITVRDVKGAKASFSCEIGYKALVLLYGITIVTA